MCIDGLPGTWFHSHGETWTCDRCQTTYFLKKYTRSFDDCFQRKMWVPISEVDESEWDKVKF